MISTASDELELSKKHEEILGKRTVLLQQMECRYEQHKSNRRQHVKLAEVANERNVKLLQDLKKMENRLRSRQLQHPDIVTLEGFAVSSPTGVTLTKTPVLRPTGVCSEPLVDSKDTLLGIS